MRLKGIIITTLLSTVLFFALVVMGVKYHWVELYKQNQVKQTQLLIPEEPVHNSNDPLIVENKEIEGLDDFEAILLEEHNASTVFTSMTKEQVVQWCNQQPHIEKLLDDLKMLAVADCVVSNYEDTYQEVRIDESKQMEGRSADNNIQKTSYIQLVGENRITNKVTRPASNNRQAQIRWNNNHQTCADAISQQRLLSGKEKQLLIDLCVADLNQ